MRLVYGPQPVLKRFIEGHIAQCAQRGLPEGGTAIGVIDEKPELIGGFYYHDWQPETGVIEISAAATDKRWFTRKTLYGLFSYPFHELNCQLVALRHSVRDEPLARMTKAYGFHQVIIPRLFGRDHDAIISTLTKESWTANGFHPEHKPQSIGG